MNALLKHTCTASVAALACAAPAFAGDTSAARLGLSHETELQRGEHLTLVEHRTSPESYRICIRQMPGDVRLKVVHDGEVTEVLDGTCETITGRHIDVALDAARAIRTPGPKLRADVIDNFKTATMKRTRQF